MRKNNSLLARSAVAFTLLLLAWPARTQIYVDQAGYLPGAKKLALTSSTDDSFYVREAGSDATVFSAATSLWKANDPATGLTLYAGDFSELNTPGRYYVSNPTGSQSPTFAIADSVYRQAYVKALRGFYYQRCGAVLHAFNAGKYAHPRCHIGDGFFHNSTDTSGFLLSRGGWHDAGDYGKYVVNAGISVATLLMAFEYFPVRFGQDNLGIPESDNTVPDILDETRVELEWLLTMQRPHGGVQHKLTSEQFSGFVMPQNHRGLRYAYQVSSAATADFAAVMARAARIFQAYDRAFSQICLDAAERAWLYLVDHPLIVPFPDGFRNPAGTNTGEYGDREDADERMWASAELFVTTGKPEYQTAFSLFANNLGVLDRAMSWQNVKALACLAYLFGQQESTDEDLRDRIRRSLTSFCQGLVRKRNASGFRVLLEPGEYFWGSNSLALNQAIILILGYRETQNPEFRDAALDQLHYVLGVNAHNLSFVTGVGVRSPMQPHHRPSIADGIEAPVPGLLVGGPNQYLQDDVLSAMFNSATPPALTYIDHADSYASNEIAINWNAPLVFVSGFFSTNDFTTGIQPHNVGSPKSYRLYQNYPNPFNASTIFTFDLPRAGFASLRIYNPLGHKVATLLSGRVEAGTHTLLFEASDLSSGVYFYEIRAGGFRALKSMLLLR